MSYVDFVADRSISVPHVHKHLVFNPSPSDDLSWHLNNYMQP